MRLSLELLMENSSARIVKQTNQNLCFGLVVKVSKSWLFIVLVLMPKSLLACWGGGAGSDGEGGGGGVNPLRDYLVPVDDKFKPNLTGIKSPTDRNIKAAWNGWEPSNETKQEWNDWYSAWQEENEKNGEGKKKRKGVKGQDGGADGPAVPDDYRGPGSGWPDLAGWADLGKGNPGVPIPPWAYVPKNIGRPRICYLPPIEGKCKPDNETASPVQRFGFNPYMDQCESYQWSGCGGTRNRFQTKELCEKHCMRDPPQSCSANSGVEDKQGHPFYELE